MAEHVAIVGYGTAGQAAAVLLSRDGHRVEVFERAPHPGPVGAGFLLQPTGLHVLWTMGLLDDALVHGARIERLYGETTAGRAVMDMRYRELEPRLFGLGMQRGALFQLLDAAWMPSRVLHAGVEVTHPMRNADGCATRTAAATVRSTASWSPAVRHRRCAVRWPNPRSIGLIRGARSGAWCRRVTGGGRTNCASAICARDAWPDCCRSARGRAIRCRASASSGVCRWPRSTRRRTPRVGART